MLKNILILIFEPTEGWYHIKRKGKMWHAFILLAAAILARFAVILLTSYPLNNVNPDQTNIIIEILLILVPVISWAISGYLVTSVSDGQTDLDQFFIASCYATVPYTVTTLPLVLLSQLLSVNSAGFFYLAQTVIGLWIAVLLIKQLSAMNDYSLGQTIGRGIIILAGIAILWFVCFICYVLSMNIIDFVRTIWLECLLIANS